MGDCLLVFGDLHFQDRDVGLYEGFIGRVRDFLLKDSYAGVILLGDIQHKFKLVDQVAQSLVCQLFKTITHFCPLYVLVGNHDYDNGAQFLTENHTLVPYKEWHNIHIIDKPTLFYFSSQPVIMVPYTPKGQFIPALSQMEFDWKKAKLIFAHQEFFDCKMGPFPSTDGDKWSDKFPIVISGHAHQRHQVGKNIHYIGMPYDHGWDESCKRYTAQVTLSKNTLGINYIPTNMPRKKIIKLDYQQALSWHPKNKDDSWKLQIVCNREEYRQFCKDCKHKFDNVRIQHINTDEQKIEHILEKRKEAAGFSKTTFTNTYDEIFYNLVQKESPSIQQLYQKIIE